jgi:hypothetical protein
MHHAAPDLLEDIQKRLALLLPRDLVHLLGFSRLLSTATPPRPALLGCAAAERRSAVMWEDPKKRAVEVRCYIAAGRRLPPPATCARGGRFARWFGVEFGIGRGVWLAASGPHALPSSIHLVARRNISKTMRRSTEVVSARSICILFWIKFTSGRIRCLMLTMSIIINNILMIKIVHKTNLLSISNS